jgi:hypothetical protein
MAIYRACNHPVNRFPISLNMNSMMIHPMISTIIVYTRYMNKNKNIQLTTRFSWHRKGFDMIATLTTIELIFRSNNSQDHTRYDDIRQLQKNRTPSSHSTTIARIDNNDDNSRLLSLHKAARRKLQTMTDDSGMGSDESSSLVAPVLDLIFDPDLNCYYNPRTGHYYQVSRR